MHHDFDASDRSIPTADDWADYEEYLSELEDYEGRDDVLPPCFYCGHPVDDTGFHADCEAMAADEEYDAWLQADEDSAMCVVCRNNVAFRRDLCEDCHTGMAEDAYDCARNR